MEEQAKERRMIGSDNAKKSILKRVTF